MIKFERNKKERDYTIISGYDNKPANINAFLKKLEYEVD